MITLETNWIIHFRNFSGCLTTDNHYHLPAMQAHVASAILKPKVIVVMGGLSMPNVPVNAVQVKSVLDKHPCAAVIGVFFMHMFEKAG
jgi:hypothetical protein